jgi:hypothetical protein
VYGATSLLNSLAFGGNYRFFPWFDLAFRQNPSIVSFALDDCDSCLGVTANHDTTGRYNGCSFRSAHAPHYNRTTCITPQPVNIENNVLCESRISHAARSRVTQFLQSDNQAEIIGSQSL